MELFESAYRGEVEKCKTFSGKENIHLILMGASACLDDARCTDPKDRSSFAPEMKEYTPEIINNTKNIVEWCLVSGASPIFMVRLRDEDMPKSVVLHKYNKNVSMLKGNGELPKGTFKS